MAAWSLISPPTTASGANFYSSGDSSADEQYVLELINRARANPPSEGQRLASIQDPKILQEYHWFSVNTGTLQGDFASYQPRPPLAMNASLSAAARVLGSAEGAQGFQGHTGSDGSTSLSRLESASYSPLAYGENTYATVENAFFGHAAYNVDWGVDDLIHRDLIMGLIAYLPTFREAGISSVAATAANYGPQVLTEEFGTASATPLALGVTYIDKDADGFYTPGEGVGGIRVSSPQSSYYTVTGSAGGYSLPLDLTHTSNDVQLVFEDANGARVVRKVTAPYLSQTVQDVAIGAALANVKIDVLMNNASLASLVANVGILSTKDCRSDVPSNGKFVLVRSGGDPGQPLDVQYTIGGDAVNGHDYRTITGAATFPAGSDRVKVKVKPLWNLSTTNTRLSVTLALDAGDGYQPDAAGTTTASLMMN